MKCFWCIKENVWKPAVRIGSTLNCCNGRLYLFGGYNKLAMNDLSYIDSKKARWVQIKATKGKRPTERYGHTTLYNGKNILYIFGGE